MGNLQTPDYPTSPTSVQNGSTPVSGVDAMSAFYSEVRSDAVMISPGWPSDRDISHSLQITSIQDDISTYNNNVNRISDLHSRTLNSTDEAANHQNAAMLDDLISQTRELGNTIKQRIQSVESQPAQPGQDMRIRKNRVRPHTVQLTGVGRAPGARICLGCACFLCSPPSVDGLCSVQICRSFAKLPTS